MEQWQKDIVSNKIEAVKRQQFSLEVDLRVMRKVMDVESEKQIIALMKKVEAQLMALEEELK